MEHVSSVRPTGKFPEKVENRKRWNFRTECRVPLTFLVVCTSSRSTVGHPATYRGLRSNGTTFYQSEIPLLLPPKFPGFFRKWKAPIFSMHTPFLTIFRRTAFIGWRRCRFGGSVVRSWWACKAILIKKSNSNTYINMNISSCLNQCYCLLSLF